MLGHTEILVIVVIAAGVLFGPSLIPKLGRNLGQGIKEFRKVGKEISKGLKEGED